MSIRGFFRQLFRDGPSRREQPAQNADRLAREIRDTSGHWTGATTYRHLEDRDRSNDSNPKP
ncbi:hypothetical protein BDK89_1026 [Ilumatobacter fluminis]|uniref:Uncharacterized protein n=1 Tax=Ilumatobacter fluminis TaxID=467091 RepID=A0A4R7HWU6_9ACTN|nr:hypothetical protein BDK89_1026 [Ilumatobacter fluminis]